MGGVGDGFQSSGATLFVLSATRVHVSTVGRAQHRFSRVWATQQIAAESQCKSHCWPMIVLQECILSVVPVPFSLEANLQCLSACCQLCCPGPASPSWWGWSTSSTWCSPRTARAGARRWWQPSSRTSQTPGNSPASACAVPRSTALTRYSH